MNGLREIVEMNNKPTARELAKADPRVQRDKLAQALRKLLKDPTERAFAEKVLAEVAGEK